MSVRYDDRLRTVLAQPAVTPHDRAIRWRQLVELAARTPPEGDRTLLDEAVAAIRDGIGRVDERVRVAAALAVAPLAAPSELVAVLASDRLAVAAPVLASARLTASEWKQVAGAASPDCKAFIAAMRSEGAQPAPPPPSPAPTPPPAPTAAQSAASDDEHPPIPSISEVVARIERLRHARDSGGDLAADAVAPGELPHLFRWECNESGDIDWVEGAPRGALVGQSIAHHGSGVGVGRSVERAFASRAPFHDGLLDLPDDVAIGGRWLISGVPAFERSSGRFAGYRGIAQRSEPVPGGGSDPNALRELAHEIRTPLNAILGFAEMIVGEYLGPADTRYRERAADIIAQARLLLTAIEDLDFAARLRSSSGERPVTDIGALAERLAPDIRGLASGKGVAIQASRSMSGLNAAIEPELAERLILRMCGAVIERSTSGEQLRLSVDRERDCCIVSISRPAALDGLDDDRLFGSASDALSPSAPFRLVRGLAQTAGAEFIANGRGICLQLPLA